MKTGIALAVSLALTTPAMAQTPPVEFIGEPSFNGQRLPFSEAVRVGDMLYLSGQLGNRLLLLENSLHQARDLQQILRQFLTLCL